MSCGRALGVVAVAGAGENETDSRGFPEAGTPAEIRAAVERIVASSEFAVPERARRFLA